jgi:ribosomal protein S12 methylthiotransferase
MRSLPVLAPGGGEAAPVPVTDPGRGRASGSAPPVVSLVSLGCAKNLVDSEAMLGQLAESGAIISGQERLADTVVVNTCGFLESSRKEALDVLRDLARRKRAGRLRRIVVAGCLVQRDGARIQEWVPEVDALVGVHNRDDVVRAVWRLDRDAGVDRYLGDYHAPAAAGWTDRARLRLTPRLYAYVRISEGCNQKCTFCTIPSIRGPMRSKTPAALVAECQEMIADGARELILIGQDTTSYGEDLPSSSGLAHLLRRLDRECHGAEWIRLMYVYPSVLTDEIIDAIADCPRIVKYIDIPLQHIHDRVLKAMHRRVTRAQTIRLLERLRSRIPGVSIRTTFIVGFPGETEAEFSALEEFVGAFRFDAVGAFLFSPEPGTPAGRMANQVAPQVRRERYERLMLSQQRIALHLARGQVGRCLEVMVDGREPRGLVARHAGQAPEVDSVTLVRSRELKAGDRAVVRCIGSDGYDLIARPVRVSRGRGSGVAGGPHEASCAGPPRV